jgi:hypothetical protein
MQVAGDVKCYHCGHVSGQVEGERTDHLVLHAFKPRAGYQGEPPKPGERIRCERCGGPVFLEDIRPILPPLPLNLPKKPKTNRTKAA